MKRYYFLQQQAKETTHDEGEQLENARGNDGLLYFISTPSQQHNNKRQGKEKNLLNFHSNSFVAIPFVTLGHRVEERRMNR